MTEDEWWEFAINVFLFVVAFIVGVPVAKALFRLAVWYWFRLPY
jgi:hypothetical protein